MKVDFEQLYRTYYMQVYSFVMTLAKNQDTSEELTQKTFVKALTAWNSYRGEASELTWLCSIAKRLWIDELRSQKKTCGLTEEMQSEKLPPESGEGWSSLGRNGGSDLEEALIEEDSAFRIHQVLHGLEEPYKEVFGLRVFGELSFLKIGKLFGKTESWARVTYHRARLKIQERMEGL